MVLIGDHKQLRPNVNNYQLAVEKGDGYDLNWSFFERLVLQDFPHTTLSPQHRMRPEISAFIRELTRPELVDVPSTHGVDSNVIFIDHRHPENEDKRISDRSDTGSSTSKLNMYEVEMVLKVVRYLAQQGYKNEDLVVLTPYLGQLLKIRDMLAKDNDPVLNDLDSREISRAGMSLDLGTSNSKKSRIRIATIDNYQGEESNVVIASLTRSNSSNAIGFMNSPERVNVLLSRARNGLILIGNSHTFVHSKEGGALWSKLFKLMRDGQRLHWGFPIKCERHPQCTLVLKHAADFDEYSRNGGCTEPCGALLNCGLHQCPKRCHPACMTPNQGDVHLTMLCTYPFHSKCDAGVHNLLWRCHNGRPSTCPACKKNEAKRLEEQALRDLEAQHKRAVAQYERELWLAELDAKLMAVKERAERALQTRTMDDTCLPGSSSSAAMPLTRIPVELGRGCVQAAGDEDEEQSAFEGDGAAVADAFSLPRDHGSGSGTAAAEESQGQYRSLQQELQLRLTEADQERKRQVHTIRGALQCKRQEAIAEPRRRPGVEETDAFVAEERKRQREHVPELTVLRQAEEEQRKQEARAEEEHRRERQREQAIRDAALRHALDERRKEEEERIRKEQAEEERRRQEERELRVMRMMEHWRDGERRRPEQKNNADVKNKMRRRNGDNSKNGGSELQE